MIRSPDIPDGFADVRERWTLPMLIEAHYFLDAVDEMREIERQRRGNK